MYKKTTLIERRIGLKKKDIIKMVVLILISILLTSIAVAGTNGLELNGLIVLGVWFVIFVIVLLLLKKKHRINLLILLYSLVISLIILISIPYLYIMIYMMNQGKRG